MEDAYFLGLIITGVSVGYLTSAPYGWLVIGVGFMVAALFAYLKG